MIHGLNSNVTHGGIQYHVQTEDLGRANPYMLTLVFQAGAIIAREKVDYREALGDRVPESEIKGFMLRQHQRIMRKVMAGQLQNADAALQADEQRASPSPSQPAKPTTLPSAEKSLDERIDAYLRSRRASKSR